MATPLHENLGQPHTQSEGRDPAVWLVDLKVVDQQPGSPGATSLSASERERAGRIRDRHKRDEFVGMRVFLRRLLGRRLSLPPDHVGLEVGARGRLECPQLQGEAFTISHSHGLGAVAIARTAAIGVDVERIVDRTHLEKIASMLFSPREYERWTQVGTRRRLQAFYELWTRKEAYLKALGVGVFDSVAKAASNVPLPAELSRPDASGTRTGRSDAASTVHPEWRWRSLRVPDGYRGAVCWIASS